MMWRYALWRDAVLLLAAAPLVYYLLAMLAGLRFFRRERARIPPEYRKPTDVPDA